MGCLARGLLLLGRLAVALGGLAIGLACLLLSVGLTAHGMVAQTARNTVLHLATPALPPALAPRDPAGQPPGDLAGRVLGADGRPVAGAAVLVADRRGVTYRASADAAGRYRLTGVPAGVYRVAAAAPGHGPAAASVTVPTPSLLLGDLRWRPPAVVRPTEFARAEVRLETPRRIAPTADARITLGPEEAVEQGAPFPGRALRQPFTLTAPTRDPVALNLVSGTLTPAAPARAATGVLYAPAEGGPYPTVLVIYPGLPETWEAVSVAIAASGFTVIAFTPLNFPDLTADVADLLYLTEQLTSGHLTRHAAPGRQCAAGGSFSTLWTFLLLQQTDAYRCVLSLGGLSDAFLYFEDWTAGRITPDPRFAPVPQMMAAMGTPDVAPDLFLALSALEHATSLPPALLVHGTTDTIVPTNQSARLAERLRALGREADLVIYSGMEHYLDANKADADTLDLLARTLAFFHRHLD